MFAARRKDTGLDMEAVEMAARAGLQRSGSAMLAGLLTEDGGHAVQVACGCGQPARYQDQRPKQLLTVLGSLHFNRAYYVCGHCRKGQSPRDRELDVEGVSYSPGVRRMMAVVGSESSFDQGREQLELLAGIQVTAKAVERQAEAIGADIEACQQAEIRHAKQLSSARAQ